MEKCFGLESRSCQIDRGELLLLVLLSFRLRLRSSSSSSSSASTNWRAPCRGFVYTYRSTTPCTLHARTWAVRTVQLVPLLTETSRRHRRCSACRRPVDSWPRLRCLIPAKIAASTQHPGPVPPPVSLLYHFFSHLVSCCFCCSTEN